MYCYLIRHGKDNESVRGGWSMYPLTEEGKKEIDYLADTIASWSEEKAFQCIYSSDLRRAFETAEILSTRINLPIIPIPEFRETNNGDLAGMDNLLALERFPGLFLNQMEWEQCYPNGESPRQFCERITNAWYSFSAMILEKGENVALVTHGGVLQVILSLVHGTPYSNKHPFQSVAHGGYICLSYENGAWQQL